MPKKYLKGKASDMKAADIWSAPGGKVSKDEWEDRIGKYETWFEKRDRENAEKEKKNEV